MIATTVIVGPSMGGVLVRLGPCEHQWAYAPTVGSVTCIRCHEHHDWGHPIARAEAARREAWKGKGA